MSDPITTSIATQQGNATANNGQANGQDNAARFEEIFYGQLSLMMAFDGFGEQQKLEGEQRQRQQEDETIG